MTEIRRTQHGTEQSTINAVVESGDGLLDRTFKAVLQEETRREEDDRSGRLIRMRNLRLEREVASSFDPQEREILAEVSSVVKAYTDPVLETLRSAADPDRKM
jgi:hypothetical protein